MWGKYCCKNQKESSAAEPFDGCDGNSLSIDSLCCKNHEQIECPSSNGCVNQRGNKAI